MITVRDSVWGVLLGVAGVLAFQSYPLWKAERMVERDAQAAFNQGFAGRRMLGGAVIKPDQASGVHVDAMAAPINFRSFAIVAEHVSWNGKRVELVLRHVVGFDRVLASMNPAHDVLVKLERRSGRFRYAAFEVRGQPPLAAPIEGNPWLALMAQAAHAEHVDPAPTAAPWAPPPRDDVE